MDKLDRDIHYCKGCNNMFYEFKLSDDGFCERCKRKNSMIVRTKKYVQGGNELIKINCPDCYSKKGVRHKDNLRVYCTKCNKLVGVFEF